MAGRQYFSAKDDDSLPTKISYDITFYLGNLFHRRLAGKSWLRELSIIPTHGAGTATTVRVCANRYYSYNKISTLF